MKTIIRLITILGALALSSTAFALPLTPSDADWQGSDPNNPDANDIETIVPTSSELDLLYKKDVDYKDAEDQSVLCGAGECEEGPFADDYETIFANSASDPSEATIGWGETDSIECSDDWPCYLLVKDGKNDPIWYVFDITGWNGTAPINLSGFWPEQGGISHVSIFGSGGTTVPEPGTLALLGLGLFGMGLMRRRQTS